MALLGFDAIGRLALAQLSRSATSNTIFVADQAALTLSGRGAGFQSVIVPTTVGLTCTGVPAATRLVLSGSQAGWLTSGMTVLYSLAAIASRGGLIISVSPAVSAGTMLGAGSGCSVSGQISPLVAALVVQNGSYQLAGDGVQFGRGLEAWFPLGMVASTWSGSDDPQRSWLPANAAESHWLDEAASNPSWDAISRPPVRWKSV
ncbi:MAG: hypothetical protein WA418_34305 [Bradyrhizobium sp.]